MKTLLIISIILLVIISISLMNACRHVSILQDITESQHNLTEAEQKE